MILDKGKFGFRLNEGEKSNLPIISMISVGSIPVIPASSRDLAACG